MVFGGALAFGWWQLRSLERDRRETQRQREQDAAGADRGSAAPSGAAPEPTVTDGEPGAVAAGAGSRTGPSPDQAAR